MLRWSKPSCHHCPARAAFIAERSTDRKWSLSSPLSVAQTHERHGPSRTKAWLTSAQKRMNKLAIFLHKNKRYWFKTLEVLKQQTLKKDSQRVCVTSLTDRLLSATEARNVCALRRVGVKGVCCTVCRVNTKASLNRKRPASDTCSKVLKHRVSSKRL